MIFKAKKDLLKLDSVELSIYLSIQSLAEETKGNELYLSQNSLLYFMLGDIKPNKATRKYIIDGFNKLLDSNALKYNVTAMGDYIINKDSFIYDNSYVFLFSEDIKTIMNTKNKDRYNLLNYLYVMMNSIDGIKRLGNMSHMWLADQCNISCSSSIKYMRELENLGIIYVRRSTKVNNDELYRQRNVYGHISNKEIINVFADNYFADKNDNSKNDRFKKSMAAKYNQICKGKKYDDYTMMQIYSYINAQNEKELLYKQENSNYIAKIRDLSVFNLT